MIRLVSLVLLFLATMAVVPFLIGEKGYVLIAMGDITLESSVVTAVILLTVIVIALFILFKVLRGGFKLSLGTWNKIAFASHRRGVRDLNKGVAAYLLSNYQQAEHLLVKSAEPSKQAQIAYLMAAKAAQEQGLSANTDHYIQLLQHQERPLKEVGLESILVQIDLLLSRQELEKARTLIDEHHRHIGHDARLLSLEIDLCIAEQRYEKAIEHFAKARKQKSVTEKQMVSWESKTYRAYFEHVISTQNTDSLTQYWQGLPRKVKQYQHVILAYCEVLALHKINQPIDALLLPVLKKGADLAFVNEIKKLPISQPEQFVVTAEKHLQKDQDNTTWLSCLGHFAFASKNYVLAEKAFSKLQQLEDNKISINDVKTFADTLIAQGQHQKAASLLRSYY